MRIHQRAEGIKFPFTKVVCPMCQEVTQEGDLHLHEIINRGSVVDKEVLAEMPIQLHIFICADCHSGHGEVDPHSPRGRDYLLDYVCRMWGREQVERDVMAWLKKFRVPLDSGLINYKILRRRNP